MTRNIGIKLLSLAFALMLWFFVVGEEKAEITVSLPVELVNISSNLVVANDVPSYINVRVYGPRSLIRAIATQGISKVIDLKDAPAGDIVIHMTPDTIPLPAGIRVLRITPQNIKISLDRTMRKRIKVTPVLTGMPNKFFEIKDVKAEPQDVLLLGPEKELSKLEEIKTIPIDIDGFTSSVEKTVVFDLNSLHVSPIEPGSVKVFIEITPKVSKRRITHIPVLIRGEQKKVLRYWPREVSAVLEGPKIHLIKLEPRDIVVEVDIRDMSQGRHKAVPYVTVPEKFVLKRLIPEKIGVYIHK